ncbi:hypothetical protein [Aneurinibacillus danicus]|uniref:Uncharacterized protein n=1 Tax=Aneurinibacillus danicus TaxID=267746 RepID=A0A511VEW2_9BACL|nr:hypothetical protein [Aneurinibacillus danicus]GEN35822.1 hypothetical protein ADA01nite_32820 [Aneurinibacillus danicus]
MSKKEYGESISDSVNDFFVLLENYPDHPKNLFVFTSFLRELVRETAIDKNSPIIEVMTVLRHEKPIIFYHMRKQTRDWMYMLTQIDMDIEEAKGRLNAIIKGTSLARQSVRR